jgi:hypothetical protein
MEDSNNSGIGSYIFFYMSFTEAFNLLVNGANRYLDVNDMG